MSKGRQFLSLRFGAEKKAEMQRYVAELNTRLKKGQAAWTLSSFLISCYDERVAKIERGRRKPHASAQAHVPDVAQVVVVPEPTELPDPGQLEDIDRGVWPNLYADLVRTDFGKGVQP
jgi:hypothetical protein